MTTVVITQKTGGGGSVCDDRKVQEEERGPESRPAFETAFDVKEFSDWKPGDLVAMVCTRMY
jgi:hypothetical protein